MLQGKKINSAFLRVKGLFSTSSVLSRSFGSLGFNYKSVTKPTFEKSIAIQNRFANSPVSLKARTFSSSSEPLGVVNKEAITNALNSKEEIKIMMVQNPSDKWWRIASVLSGFLPAAILLAFGYHYVYNKEELATNEFSVAPAHAKVLQVEERFADVKGIDEAKSELSEVVDYLKNPDKYTHLGARLPKGVLLVGEPGNGKTLLARAVAGESGVPFFYVSGSAFDEMFVGVGPRRVRDLFEEAKKNSPCIIFIDEIDAIGVARRYSMNGGSFAKESTLNQLLTELDGFKQSSGIIVVAATNLPESLDPALTRPGRFDKIVNVPVPDLNGRKQIIDLYLQKTKFDPQTVDSITLARGTTGFTGAELSNLINIAAIKAATQGLGSINMHTLEEARDDIIMGGKKRTVIRTPEELKVTAYHEAGHAICALKCHESDGSGSYPLHKATIMMRGNSLGVTSFLPERDEFSQTKKQLQTRLKCLMAGRVAEEIIFGKDGVTTGASDDFRKASQLARGMVTRMGFSEKIGPVYYDNTQERRPVISEQQQNEIDSEVKRILSNSYDDAKNILKENESQLHLLAGALLQHETLSAEEIKKVITNKPQEKKL